MVRPRIGPAALAGARFFHRETKRKLSASMHWKGLLVIALITAITVAVVTRVTFLRSLVFGSTPAAS